MSGVDWFTLRDARAADRSAILALVPRLRAFGPSTLRTPEALDAGERRVLERFFDAPVNGTALVVAERADGVVIGAAFAEEEIDYFTQEANGHLGILVVAAAAEGRGVGRALIANFERWAQAAGHRFVTINVFATNARAAQLYERAGYEPDTLRYAKTLPPAV